MASEGERPHIEDLPGTWPSASANSFRQHYLRPDEPSGQQFSSSHYSSELKNIPTAEGGAAVTGASSNPPAVPSPPSSEYASNAEEEKSEEAHLDKGFLAKGADKSDELSDDEHAEATGHFEPIKAVGSNASRPRTNRKETGFTEEDMARVLSRRKTNGTVSDSSIRDEQEEIERLMSRMFGANRQANSEDEKTRHVGVVFKNLTVKGMGLGAALQRTIGDPFMALPRLLTGLVSGKRTARKPPVRTLIDNFNGCIRPGEMLLVLGRPGSGCSTFLKVLANQRFGYESIGGDVTYGGTDAKTMSKDFRGEILYNPEDDLHYATLSVKNTLSFALKTRTPGKASRNEGESRGDYVREFLRVVAKLFWIEHTMNTKVGNEYVRGVSGGEKKRVSIAEAMITKASTQCWDNSTRGLDASTALEYVESLRSLTNMAHISTSVALYQAGETLYECFDKVVLIEEGKCLYYGPTDKAVEYFEGLGFRRPNRWTTADFVRKPLVDPQTLLTLSS